MISELDETIRQILIKEGGFDATEIDISFEMPTREWSGSISKPTVNCYLFDIRENVERRQQGVQTDTRGPNGVVRRRPPVFFDLTYLVSAWTRVVEDEHRLLWHALRTLTRFPALPAAHLQGALREVEGPIYAQTAPPNGVFKNPNDFWGALDNQLRPAIAFVVSLAFERTALPAGPPVLTTILRFQPPETAAEEFIWFGGTLHEADAPVADAQVMVEGRAERTTTDAEGRFRLRVPRPGSYALLVEQDGRTVRHTIDVPATQYALTLDAPPQPAVGKTATPRKGEPR